MNYIKRREFIKLISAGALSGLTTVPKAMSMGSLGQNPSNKKPMNILFIGSDDMRCELGCYGREHIHSLNIDRIAKEGVLFERAYVQQAVCTASRASFLTGCRPDTTGVDYPYTKKFKEEFLEKYPDMPSFFYDRGYYSRTFGKVHHGYSNDLSEPHWWIGGKNKYYALEENIKKGGKKKRNENTPPFECADVPDDTYRDGKLANEVIKTLRRIDKQDKPFFLGVGFHKPHLPWSSPKKYWDLYDENEIELSPNPFLPDGAPEYASPHFSLKNYAGPDDAGGKQVPEDYARKLRHAYYACVSFIDAQVGKIINELERLGMKDNTIIMFWGDHGWHLGDQSNWDKHTNYERATHAPLIVSVPGMETAGSKTEALVEYVDMFPTLIELAGYEVPQHFEGISFTPLLKNPKKPWKTAAFSQFPRWDVSADQLPYDHEANVEGYAIRTNRYRYIEWRNKKNGEVTSRELYDHKYDPFESISVADRPQYSAVLKELEKRLKDGWKAALPSESD